jgi:cytochrome c oxidase cbb3-type subunit 3
MNAHCVTLLLLGALAITGCEREARRFATPRTGAALPDSIRQSELRPGVPSPPVQLVNDYEQNAPALAEGQRLYRWYNCNGCHANGGGGQGPALMDATWLYGSEPANIYASIVEGRPNGMPAFGGRIPESQVWKIAAYVRSMSGLVRADTAPSRRDAIHSREPENRIEPAPVKHAAPAVPK